MLLSESAAFPVQSTFAHKNPSLLLPVKPDAQEGHEEKFEDKACMAHAQKRKSPSFEATSLCQSKTTESSICEAWQALYQIKTASCTMESVYSNLHVRHWPQARPPFAARQHPSQMAWQTLSNMWPWCLGAFAV